MQVCVTQSCGVLREVPPWGIKIGFDVLSRNLFSAKLRIYLHVNKVKDQEKPRLRLGRLYDPEIIKVAHYHFVICRMSFRQTASLLKSHFGLKSNIRSLENTVRRWSNKSEPNWLFERERQIDRESAIFHKGHELFESLLLLVEEKVNSAKGKNVSANDLKSITLAIEKIYHYQESLSNKLPQGVIFVGNDEVSLFYASIREALGPELWNKTRDKLARIFVSRSLEYGVQIKPNLIDGISARSDGAGSESVTH